MFFDNACELDFETFCKVNVVTVGAYRYITDPSLDVLCMSYRIIKNGRKGKTKRWIPPHYMGLPDHLAKHQSEVIPDDLAEFVANTDFPLVAHNSQFEMLVWEHHMVKHYGADPVMYDRWRCTAAMCAASGLPRSLGNAGAALNLRIQKDKRGSALLRKFAAPRKPTKLNASTRVWPGDQPEEFEALLQYCDTDVETEGELLEALPDSFAEDEMFWRDFQLDIRINERGIPLDMDAVRTGYKLLGELEKRCNDKIIAATGGVRASQRDKFLSHIQGLGVDIENLQAKTIKDFVLLNEGKLEPETLALLKLRIEGGKASTKKLKKMLEVVLKNGRVHGSFLFYGAHTGRWSGKLIQPQNFPRGEYEPHQLELLFKFILDGYAEGVEICYEFPIDAIAQGMRGFLFAPKGRKFVVCDFSAIEARVLAWMAGQESTLEAYFADQDLYCLLALKLYPELGNDVDAVDWKRPDNALKRKFAKDVFLGCGYQLGGPGFQSNCMKRGIVIELDFAKQAVKTYRDDNPKVVQWWADIEAKAIRAVELNATRTKPVQLRNLAFFVDGIWFCIRLPSGRLLRYAYPKVERAERWGKPVKKLTYRAEYKGKWVREGTYGGKLVENIVQAIARDLMVFAAHNAEKQGYDCVGTVHDELITEVDEGFGSVKELIAIMRILPKWAKGAPINAAGWQGRRYRK